MDDRSLALRHKRSLGSYYTPGDIADAVVLICESSAERDRRSGIPLRVLDPACGDGAFLLAWLRSQEKSQPDRLDLVRNSVFGVDVDPKAIESVRTKISEWIGELNGRQQEVSDVLDRNLIWGDALIGEDWCASPSGSQADQNEKTNGEIRPVVDWKNQFAQVAAEGGFDLILGNPPYLRERNAKIEFDRISKSSLGKRWRRPRMDLWHYFLHRGLDLLKPNGILTYLVNSYWTQSTSGRTLVERLADTTTMEHVLFFGRAKLFTGVAGQHMVFQLRKSQEETAPCRVFDLTDVPVERVPGEIADAIEKRSGRQFRTISQADLWIRGITSVDTSLVSQAIPETSRHLQDQFEVRQGIAENPPFITKSMSAGFGDSTLTGQGVFVLTNDEVTRFELSANERTLLRPYYDLRSIDRFHVSSEPSHQILYLTSATAPSIDTFPQIKTHLERFRSTLERRREVREGTIPWWVLHWPRQERLFVEPRILCVQMGLRPRFAFVEKPTFVGFSMNLIVDSRFQASNQLPFDQVNGQSTLSLPSLTAILNSSPARDWFQIHAKKRGINLDISGTTLKEFPLPSNPSPEIVKQLDSITRNWKRSSSADSSLIESLLDELVHRLYQC